MLFMYCYPAQGLLIYGLLDQQTPKKDGIHEELSNKDEDIRPNVYRVNNVKLNTEGYSK